MMTKMLTKEQATNLLRMADYADYKVTKIYENGFKAIRTNEWIKSELYCELLHNYNCINQENIIYNTVIITMVVERYK